MRPLLIGLAAGAAIFAASGGRILFLPVLFVPFAIYGLRRRWQHQLRTLADHHPLRNRREPSVVRR